MVQNNCENIIIGGFFFISDLTITKVFFFKKKLKDISTMTKMSKENINVSLMVHYSYILAHLLITGDNSGCQCSTYLIRIMIDKPFKIKLSVTKCTKDKYKRGNKSLRKERKL